MVARNSKRSTRNNAKLVHIISDNNENANVSVKSASKLSKNEELKKPSYSNRRMREEDQDSELSDFENSSMFEKQFYVPAQKRGSNYKPDPSKTESMWRYYPKQVQSILKKKRIDRERLRRSLKPPGKRNYKSLFSNLQKVCVNEMSKASVMFKDMKDIFYKLTNAERSIQRSLKQKGLFLDQKDFDIMAVFNQGMTEYYDENSEMDNTEARKRSYYHKSENGHSEIYSQNKHEKIHVEDFDSTSAKQRSCTPQFIDYKNNDRLREISQHQNAKAITPCSIPISGLSKASTPNSNGFDYLSHISRNTHKSNNTFRSENSRRMLFPVFRTERREGG